jgi:hypothetical protein
VCASRNIGVEELLSNEMSGKREAFNGLEGEGEKGAINNS